MLSWLPAWQLDWGTGWLPDGMDCFHKCDDRHYLTVLAGVKRSQNKPEQASNKHLGQHQVMSFDIPYLFQTHGD